MALRINPYSGSSARDCTSSTFMTTCTFIGNGIGSRRLSCILHIVPSREASYSCRMGIGYSLTEKRRRRRRPCRYSGGGLWTTGWPWPLALMTVIQIRYPAGRSWEETWGMPYSSAAGKPTRASGLERLACWARMLPITNIPDMPTCLRLSRDSLLVIIHTES